MRFVLLLIIFFLYIFAPVFNGIDLLFVTSAAMCLIGLFAFDLKTLFKSANYFYVLIPLFFYVLINAIFTCLEFNINDVLFCLLKPIRIIITVIGAFVLVNFTKKLYGQDFEKYCLVFVFLSIFLHALIMAYESISPAFRTLLQTTLFAGQDTRGSWNEQFRMGGLMGAFGGAVTSVVQSTGVLLVPFLIRYCKNTLTKVVIFFMAAVIFYSVLICGRSGLWGIIFFLPYIVYKLNRRNVLKLITGGVVIGVLLIIGFSFLINYTTSSSGNEDVQTMFSRTFDTFIDYKNTGTFEDETTNTLLGMIILPDPITFLFGNASHMLRNDFERTLNSDIGYIRDLWSMGIFGMFIYLLPYFKMAKKVKKKRDLISVCSFALLLVTLAFNAKEMFLYCRCLLSITMLIYFAAVIGYEYKNDNNLIVNKIIDNYE